MSTTITMKVLPVFAIAMAFAGSTLVLQTILYHDSHVDEYHHQSSRVAAAAAAIGNTRGGVPSIKHKQELPYCSLESPQDAEVALGNAIWIDPLTPKTPALTDSPTLVPRPTSQDLDKVLEAEIAKDPADEARLRRIARMVLDTQSDTCRLAAWNAQDFGTCVQGRRIILVGDSMTMQMTESLAYLLNLGETWSYVDKYETKKGDCRHCIDAVTSNGIEIKGRAMFYSDEDDKHPLKFGMEAWQAMEKSIDGWKEGDILVVNFGAHYSANLMALRNDLNELFYNVLAKLPKDKVTVFWRAYAPAHFQSFADGEYPPSHQVKFAGEPACVPHLLAPHTPSTVEHAVTHIFEECGDYCSHIRRIPTWHLLRNAWDQHKEGSHCYDDTWCDCRHYTHPGPMEYAAVLLYHQLCVAPPPSSETRGDALH